VNGRNTANWGKRFTLDVWYVDHWTLTLDVRILALTIRRVMGGDGISAEGQATMTEFMGG
jgi:lipopolysaccharide/colanic/teichoic acid biosynthesis glycosyltransferase